MDGEKIDLNVLKKYDNKELNLNDLLYDEEKKVIFIDKILIFIQEFAEKYPQFGAEISIYEIKESLVFLNEFDLDKSSYTVNSASIIINRYIEDLKIIADKKKRKKTRKDYSRQKAEKAIDILYDIRDYFYGNDNINDEEWEDIVGREKDMREIIKNLIEELYYELYLLRDDIVTPTIANKRFDKDFSKLLENRAKNNKFTPLELGKAIAQVRITIRNIFNNKPNIRLNSDKKA
jgi:hypothetical protein|nr:hypothetical protein [uncultured Campylobacter sp.]